MKIILLMFLLRGTSYATSLPYDEDMKRQKEIKEHLNNANAKYNEFDNTYNLKMIKLLEDQAKAIAASKRVSQNSNNPKRVKKVVSLDNEIYYFCSDKVKNKSIKLKLQEHNGSDSVKEAFAFQASCKGLANLVNIDKIIFTFYKKEEVAQKKNLLIPVFEKLKKKNIVSGVVFKDLCVVSASGDVDCGVNNLSGKTMMLSGENVLKNGINLDVI